MAGEGKLCYKLNDGRLAFKRGGDGSLMFKVAAGDWTQVSFAWGSDGRDLDICAYWEDAPNMKGGYNYDTSGIDRTDGAYHLICSSDVTSEDGSEWCKIKMKPWNNGMRRTFKIHFHYFPQDNEHPSTSCTVIASQIGGQTIIKRDQSCNNDSVKRAANTDDPYCVVSFDETGKLIRIE